MPTSLHWTPGQAKHKRLPRVGFSGLFYYFYSY